VFANGDEYKGSFEKGKKSGSGVYQWKEGDNYQGEWRNDMING